jgi:ATP-dependent DNA ligase
MRQLPKHTSSSGRWGLFENRCTSDERHQAVNQRDGKKEENPLEFARLAHSFEKLEQTSSRLALIAILAELFRSIEHPDEIEKVCYLLQGRVAPFFEALEIGMAEKTVARSIAIAYHTTPEHVFTLYTALGDLGLVAEQLRKEAASVSRDLQVDAVFEGLKTIAQTSGKGTVEKRIALLADLLRQVDSVSAKYVVRIAMGNLRLGSGDATMLDTLATAKWNDPHKRKVLEGVVAKKLDSSYEAGARNFNWVKLKRHAAGALQDTIDCVLLGYIFGRGKRATLGAGALLVGVYDPKQDMFVTVSKIGTGLTDEEWRSLKERTKGLVVDHKPARVSSLIEPSVWLEPKIVVEVLADEITRSPIHTAGKERSRVK